MMVMVRDYHLDMLSWPIASSLDPWGKVLTHRVVLTRGGQALTHESVPSLFLKHRSICWICWKLLFTHVPSVTAVDTGQMWIIISHTGLRADSNGEISVIHVVNTKRDSFVGSFRLVQHCTMFCRLLNSHVQLLEKRAVGLAVGSAVDCCQLHKPHRRGFVFVAVLSILTVLYLLLLHVCQLNECF